MAYRVYVTDSLQLAPQGKILSDRWYDKVNQTEVDSFEDILASVVECGGLVIE